MNIRHVAVMIAALMMNMTTTTWATERYFTYSYEPETFPKGVAEFEQHITLRSQRNSAVGQENFNKWEIREEFEYGVTDRYTVSLYLNTVSESFRDPATATNFSEFKFDGISLENRYMLWNPAEHKIGITLYFEPRFSGDEAELEQKIIFGQRCGNWKWALNLSHAMEWSNSLKDREGEVELTFGLARAVGKHWAFGVELRDHNELPDYHYWENTAVFLGPVFHYQTENWWATLTILPQIYGNNFQGNPDGNRGFDLEGHERLNVRLIFGIGF